RVQVASNGMNRFPHADGADHHEAGVAVDDDGNLYYTWVAHDRLPYLAISRNGGTTWSTPIMIGHPGVKEANLPALAIGSKGRIAVAYVGSENSPGVPFSDRRNAYANVTWNGYITMTTDALAADPVFYSAPVNAPADPIAKGVCLHRCRAIGDFIDVQIGPDGVPWTALVDTCAAGVCDRYTGSLDGSEGGGLGAALAGRLSGGPSLVGP
ncbi:MAG TPA: sialidase family protein, partial [Acidimicrobiales bacterium]|nr:sialidase family protein [Acidimicrobiales bacterium]